MGRRRPPGSVHGVAAAIAAVRVRSLARRVPDSAQASQNLLPVAAEGEVLAQARIAGTEAATGVEGDLQIESGPEAEPRESVAGPPGIGNLRCVESGDMGLFGCGPLNVWLPAARGALVTEPRLREDAGDGDGRFSATATRTG